MQNLFHFVLSFLFLFQIEETKRKQRVGIQNILSKRFSSEQIEECFRNSAQDITTTKIIIQQKADDITDKPTTASQSRPLEKGEHGEHAYSRRTPRGRPSNAASGHEANGARRIGA